MRKAFLVAVLAACCISAANATYADAKDAKIQALEAQNVAKDAQIQALKAQNAALTADAKILGEQLNSQKGGYGYGYGGKNGYGAQAKSSPKPQKASEKDPGAPARCTNVRAGGKAGSKKCPIGPYWKAWVAQERQKGHTDVSDTW